MSALRLTFLSLFFLFGLVLACGGPPPPVEEIEFNWTRIKGTPAEDGPFIDTKCISFDSGKTFLMPTVAGRDRVGNPSDTWTVTVGDWSTEDKWYSPLPTDFAKATNVSTRVRADLKDKHGRRDAHDRGLWNKVAHQIATSDVSSFTIDMGDAVYTFPATPDVREYMAEAWADCWPGG